MQQLFSAQSSGINFNGKAKLVGLDNATSAQKKQFKSLAKSLKHNNNFSSSDLNSPKIKDKFVSSKKVSETPTNNTKNTSVVTPSVTKNEEPNYNPFMDTYYNPFSERLMNFENPIEWFVGIFFK